jgi:hypothetical protein
LSSNGRNCVSTKVLDTTCGSWIYGARIVDLEATGLVES